MSLQAEKMRNDHRLWALPGGSHDRLITVLKGALPICIGILTAFLATAPFASTSEVSFVLDKNKVEVAKERMRVIEALYRGEDSKQQPFSLRASSAIQKTSTVPIVDLRDMSARVLLSDGPAVLDARQGRYNMQTEKIMVDGAVQFQSAGGYRMTTRDVIIDMQNRGMHSNGRVDGRMPVGTFAGDHLDADMTDQTVTLNGHATLHIQQNGLKGQSR